MQQEKQIFCQVSGHNLYHTLFICLKKDCQYDNRIFCQKCLIQTKHFADDQQFIILINDIIKEDSQLVENFPPIDDNTIRAVIDKANRFQNKRDLSFISQFFQNLKTNLNLQLDKLEKDIIVKMQNLQNQTPDFVKNFSEDLKKVFQYDILQALIKDFYNGKNDFEKTQINLKQYIAEVNDEQKMKEVNSLKYEASLLLNRFQTSFQKITDWFTNNNFLTQINQFSIEFNSLMQAKQQFAEQLYEITDNSLIEKHIQESDPHLWDLGQSNLQFHKSTYSDSPKIQNGIANEFNFQRVSNQHIYSDHFGIKDKVILKVKIQNFQDDSLCFVIGVTSLAKINENQHSKYSGITVSKSSNSYKKGELKCIGFNLQFLELQNCILYLYVNIENNVFALFDEQKQMIYSKNNQFSQNYNQDFENQYKEWCIVIAGYQTQMNVTIMNICKQQ